MTQRPDKGEGNEAPWKCQHDESGKQVCIAETDDPDGAQDDRRTVQSDRRQENPGGGH